MMQFCEMVNVHIAYVVAIICTLASNVECDVFSIESTLDCPSWSCRDLSVDPLCRCDKSCVLYGDCCYDFYVDNYNTDNVESFLSQYNATVSYTSVSDPLIKYWVNIMKKYGACEHHFGAFKSESYEIISRCPEDVNDDGLVDKCVGKSDDFMSEVPVSYIAPGYVHVAFRNMYCSMCHNIPQDKIFAWNVHVKRNCTEDNNKNTSISKVFAMENIHPSCIDNKQKPYSEHPYRFRCFPKNSFICEDHDFEEGNRNVQLCETYFHGVTVNISGSELYFRNPHCIPCPSLRVVEAMQCEEPDSDRFHPSFENKLDVNLVVLFDFRRGLSMTINQNVYVRTDDLCDSNFIYDTVLQTCIEVICPDAQRLSKQGCVYDEDSWKFVSDTNPEHKQIKTYQLIFSMMTKEPITEDLITLFKLLMTKDDNEWTDFSVDYRLINETMVQWSAEMEAVAETTTRAARRDGKGSKKGVETTPASTASRKGSEIGGETTTMSTANRKGSEIGGETSTISTASRKDSEIGGETTSTSTTFKTSEYASNIAQSTTSAKRPNKENFILPQDNFTTTERAHEEYRSTTGADMSKSVENEISGFTTYDVNVKLVRKGRINGKIDKIIEILSNIPDMYILPEIIVKSFNRPLECDRTREEYVEIDTVVKIDGYYYGVDNASRALVDIDITDFEIHFNELKSTFANVSYCKRKTLDCPMGLYNVSDFTFLDNGTLINKCCKKKLEKQNYLIRGTNVLTCINLSAMFQVKAPELISKHETLLSIIVEAVSVFCLYVTGILYCDCFGIKTCNSRSIMSLSLTLGTAQCLFFIPANNTEVTCKVKAVALHFFWLSSFFWMSVIGFDYAKTFRVGTTRLRQVDRKLDLKYLTFAFGIPAVFVAVCVCIDELASGNLIGYGLEICWIGKSNAYFIVFAIPVISIIFVNMSFFTITVFGINRAKFSKGSEKSAPKRSLVVVYVRLCFIMGLTWIIAFVAGYFDFAFLWYVHIALNGLQGLNIFFTFVLNKRTIQTLKKEMSKKSLSSARLTLSSLNGSSPEIESYTTSNNNDTNKF